MSSQSAPDGPEEGPMRARARDVPSRTPQERSLPAPDLSVDMIREDGALRLVVHGEIDMANASRIRDAFLDACGQSRTVELDLADVEFMDSSGLAALVSVRRHADRDGCGCVVVAVSEPVRRLLELTQTLEWLQGGSA